MNVRFAPSDKVGGRLSRLKRRNTVLAAPALCRRPLTGEKIMRGAINSGSIRLLWLLGLAVALICQIVKSEAADERKQLAFDAVDRNAEQMTAISDSIF